MILQCLAIVRCKHEIKKTYFKTVDKIYIATEMINSATSTLELGLVAGGGGGVLRYVQAVYLDMNSICVMLPQAIGHYS
jgi:hypothetical protein